VTRKVEADSEHFCISTVTCPREPINFSHLLYARSGSSGVPITCDIVPMAYCVNLSLREANCWHSALGIQLVWKMIVAEARFYTGTPELMCKAFSYFKRETDAICVYVPMRMNTCSVCVYKLLKRTSVTTADPAKQTTGLVPYTLNKYTEYRPS
jgi:hypothetical protein